MGKEVGRMGQELDTEDRATGFVTRDCMKKGSKYLCLSLALVLMTVSSACAQEDEHLEKVRR